jgi:3-hydroxyacyl-CoA dehydrogenase/enoyl-CoA hydratase/3-hydroxybutyryl-CoA epimerase
MQRMPCPRRERGVWSWLIDRNPFALWMIHGKARDGLQMQTHGHYPAPVAAMKLVLAAPSTRIERGLEREAVALGTLAVSSVAKNLIELFRMSEDAKKLAKLPSGADARAIERAGVVGGGVMGAGIAALLAEKGLQVRLSDIARPALDAALLAHAANVERSLRKRYIEAHQARAARDRLEATTALDGFARCGIAIEAVAEKLEIKRTVFAKLAAQMASDAILATNTSSLSVDAIAAGVAHPERVVGMHFFNPVHAMPLVEIVRGTATDDATVAATAKLALALGKTPVVVRDVAGFLVNRVLGPYLDEAVRLFELGVDPLRIEKAALDFGMPMGPLELLDEVGLDIAAHAAQSLETAYGERMQSSRLVARLLEAGLKGKKGGAGFFLYAEDPRSRRPKRDGINPAVVKLAGSGAPTTTDAELADRLVLAMAGEGARCLVEGVVASERELDLAMVFGTGFPPFRGGLMRYVRARGIDDVAAALDRLAAAPDVRARDGARERFDATSVRALAQRA